MHAGILGRGRTPASLPAPRDPASAANAQDLEIQDGGVRLRGWRFRYAGVPRGTVIYLHGSADNRTSGLFVAERFTRRGYDVVVYDSRAHGESEGEACTYGYHEKQDLRRVIDTVAPGPVAVLGVSLGGAVALQAAAIDARIRTVVAVSTFSDLRTIATERAPRIASKKDIAAALRLAEATAHFRVDDVSPAASAREIAVPVLLVHGEDDRETPSAHSQRVFAALPGPKRLLVVPGAGHDDALTPGRLDRDRRLDRRGLPAPRVTAARPPSPSAGILCRLHSR